jgi:hypothetical protein
MTNLAISEGTIVFPTPKLVLYHINIMPSPYFFTEKLSVKGHTSKNCGQPRDPIDTTTLDTFSPPPLVRDHNPLHPLTNNTHESAPVVAKWPNSASTQNAHVANIGNAANRLLSTPPNCLCAAHISIALPTAATKTEQQDNANRSIGQTYCIKTAADGPYAAVGIIACNRIVVIDAPCT